MENDVFQALSDNVQPYEASFLSFLEYHRKHEFEFLEDHAAKQSFTQEFYNYAHAEVVYTYTYTYANDKLTFQNLCEKAARRAPAAARRLARGPGPSLRPAGRAH